MPRKNTRSTIKAPPTNGVAMVAAALTIFNRKREKAALGTLCERLGISDSQPEWMKWALIGRLLAFEQPEFAKKRGRGRPRAEMGVDRQRALFIEQEQSEEDGRQGSISVASLIKKATTRDHPLFPQNIGIDTLASSVSRGNKALKEDRAWAKRLKKQRAAREEKRTQ